MNFIIIILIAGLLYLKITNKVKISWWVIGALVAVYFFFSQNILAYFGISGPNTSDPAKIDECGCGPGQQVSMSRRNMWGNWKNNGIVPCATALQRVNSSSKHRINGCVN